MRSCVQFWSIFHWLLGISRQTTCYVPCQHVVLRVQQIPFVFIYKLIKKKVLTFFFRGFLYRWKLRTSDLTARKKIFLKTTGPPRWIKIEKRILGIIGGFPFLTFSSSLNKWNTQWMQMDYEWPLKATPGHHYFSGLLAGHPLLITTMVSVQTSVVLSLYCWVGKGLFLWVILAL